MKVSERGLQFVAAREACTLTAHMDTTTLAVGFGQNNKNLKPDDEITIERAVELMCEFADGLDRSLNIIFGDIKCAQHQYDAVFSAAYNLGPTWLKNGNQHLIGAVKVHAEAPADLQLRDLAGLAFCQIKGPPKVKDGPPRYPFNMSRRARECVLYTQGDYGDLSTMKLFRKNPREGHPFEVVPMARFAR